MSVASAWLGQLRSLWPTVPLVQVVTLAVLVAVGAQNRVPSSFLVRDPAQVAKYPFYIGLLSNAGVLLWCAAVAVCLFTATVVRHRERAIFVLASGLVTAMLLLDDFLILHEQVFPEDLLVPERLVLGVYGLVMLLYLVRFRRAILATEYLLMLIAFGFFGASTVLDTGVLDQGLNYLLDDGLKLLGIVSWTTYFVRTCREFVVDEHVKRHA